MNHRNSISIRNPITLNNYDFGKNKTDRIILLHIIKILRFLLIMKIKDIFLGKNRNVFFLESQKPFSNAINLYPEYCVLYLTTMTVTLTVKRILSHQCNVTSRHASVMSRHVSVISCLVLITVTLFSLYYCTRNIGKPLSIFLMKAKGNLILYLFGIFSRKIINSLFIQIFIFKDFFK